MSLETLIEISRYYGKNPDYVLAGGGNTSWKDSSNLYVKASGTALASASADSFVKMDRQALAKIWDTQYPESSAERESAVLADMMAARAAGEEHKRPSVEALLHDLQPFAFVVHLHPAMVNGLTCSQQGEAAMAGIFGSTALWIPSCNPGYVLSKTVKTAMDRYKAKRGIEPAIIFLQNHGIFVSANDPGGIYALYAEIMQKISSRIHKHPDLAADEDDAGSPEIERAISITRKTLAELAGTAASTQSGFSEFMSGGAIGSIVADSASFAPVASAFTPDHIVYSGSDPLFTEARSADGIREAWKSHTEKTGKPPKIVAVRGLGIFSAAATEKAAAQALVLFKDTIKVAAYAEFFGGPLFMAQNEIDFINNWEVERFRAAVSQG